MFPFGRREYCRAELTFCGVSIPVDIRIYRLSEFSLIDDMSRRDPRRLAAAAIREPGTRRRVFSARELRRMPPALAVRIAALVMDVNSGALVPDVPDETETTLAELAAVTGMPPDRARRRVSAADLVAFVRRRAVAWKRRDKWEFYLALLTQMVGAIGGARLKFDDLLIDWDARSDEMSETDAMYELAEITGATVIDLRGMRNDDNDA